jgi:hypothetical protein
MRLRLLIAAVGLTALLAACAQSGPPAPSAQPSPTAAAVVDCGVSNSGPGITYDAVGRQCVWSAYASGSPTRWVITSYTTEGAPIRTTLTFESGVLLMTRDMTADGFSSPADRRLWSWRCSTMTKRPFVTDPQHYSFELAGCTGEVARAVFP